MNNISDINNIPKEYMYDPDFKTKLKTILIGDIITYPDENVFLIKDKGLVFNIDDSIKGWTSEPNE